MCIRDSVKLVAELARVLPQLRRGPQQKAGSTLYVLDEPTVGLHMADVDKLLAVLHRLVDAGNTVVLIEHNLDVMAAADWVIDMGPEAGGDGGRIVAQGAPQELAKRAHAPGKAKVSHTARALAEFLADRTE